MKLHQLIFPGCAIFFLTALPSFAETKDKKVILVPGENLFPLKCETIQGSIDANDRIDPPGSLHNYASRYDSYGVKTAPGNIVFFELTIPNQNNSNFIPLLTTLNVNGLRYSISAGRLPVENPDQTKRLPHQVWYFSRKATETKNRNLYISSATFGTYNLRIAYARPSINLSESQIEETFGDLSSAISGVTGQLPNVDMNALCKN